MLADKDEKTVSAFFLEPRPEFGEARVRVGWLWVVEGLGLGWPRVRKGLVMGSFALHSRAQRGWCCALLVPHAPLLCSPPQRWEFRSIVPEDIDGWLEVFREFGCTTEASVVEELRAAQKLAGDAGVAAP